MGMFIILGVFNGLNIANDILSLGVTLAYLAIVSGTTPVGCGIKIFQAIYYFVSVCGSLSV